VRPFCVAGGTPVWPQLVYVSGAPQLAGAQLLCSHYVGEGMVGFVKQIKAAPFKPSILHNAEYTELVPSAVQALLLDGTNPDSDNGWWSTPFGWEGYAERLGGGLVPRWTWHIQLIPGRIDAIRTGLNAPPFSFFDPNSWFLVPQIPVPASAYQSGLPGNAPGDWGPQRLQFTNWEAGEVHIIVPTDTTVALFAMWEQEAYNPFYQATNGAGTVDLAKDILVLGPSFGQLVGYTQPLNRAAARRNAVYGWAS
jgi:hypothetical protein